MPSVHQCAIAEIHDSRPCTLVCPCHGSVHKGTGDRLSVAGSVRHFLGRIVPVQCCSYVACVEIKPGCECSERRSDHGHALARGLVGIIYQLANEITLRGDRAYQRTGTKEHIGTVMPFELLLKVWDEFRVHMPESWRLAPRRAKADGCGHAQ
jgi:hypothetical protein